jgi:hypothetical protein
MKRCANCGNLADDDARYCDVCGQSSFEAEPGEAPAATVEPTVAQDERPQGEAGAPSEAPAPEAPAPEAEIRHATAAAPAPAVLVESAPPEATAAETVIAALPDPAPPPLTPAEPAPETARGQEPSSPRAGDADDLEQEITADDIAQVRADGWFTIGLIGFPTAGKTWFLNRVKERYSSGLAAYTVAPPKIAQLDEVRGSTVITLHRFVLPEHVARRRENRGLHSFVVLDIPGEAMARAVDRLASRYDIALGADIVLEAFNVCDALIIMMPVDELLFSHLLADHEKMAWLRANGAGVLLEVDGERQALAGELATIDTKARPGRALSKADAARREALVAELAAKDAEWREWMTAQSALNVDKFCDNLGKFANVIHLLQTSNALDIAEVRISEIIRGVAKQSEATATPVLFALSKMDAMSSLPDDYLARLKAVGIEADALPRVGEAPAKAVRELAPGVAKHLTQHFQWLKFECVTAFEGQKPGDLRIDYERAHYGVDAIIDWINRIDDFTSGAPATVRDVAWARRVGPA